MFNHRPAGKIIPSWKCELLLQKKFPNHVNKGEQVIYSIEGFFIDWEGCPSGRLGGSLYEFLPDSVSLKKSLAGVPYLSSTIIDVSFLSLNGVPLVSLFLLK